MWDLINKNKRDSFLLLFFFLLFSLGAILIMGYFFMILFGFLFGVILIFGASLYVIYKAIHSYYHAHEIVIKSVGAIPIDEYNLPADKKEFLKDTVETLAIAANVPTPKLYIMESPMINAFATGKDPEHSIICITTGALEKLNREEIEGVLGHEMGHIVNYDIRFVTFASVLLAFLVTMSGISLRLSFFGEDNRNGGYLLILGLVLALLAPLIGAILNAVISRQREFLADATSAKLTRNPNELISALQKIELYNKRFTVPSNVRALMIWEPHNIFATHPPIKERIKRLQEMLYR